MHCTITSELRSCLSENGFSLDELVYQIKEAYETSGFVSFIELILKFVQEKLILETVYIDKRNWGCCDEPAYVSNGSYPRKLKTSLGKICMRWIRVKCKCCGKTPIPLKEFLGIEKHQYKSNELEQIIIDDVSDNIYRRAVETVSSIGFVSIPHSTAHRWVLESDCDLIDCSKRVSPPEEHKTKELFQIVPDGTKFKGTPADGEATKGNLKVVIGVGKKGDVFPIGAWTSENWKEIAESIKKQGAIFSDGTILVSDGEAGIAEAFSDLATEEQRCHWHIVRDLYHTMWQDGSNIKEVKPIQKALTGVFQIELPAEDFERVSELEKDDIEQRMENAEQTFLKLIAYLDEKGYSTAANYLTRSYRGMFGHHQ